MYVIAGEVENNQGLWHKYLSTTSVLDKSIKQKSNKKEGKKGEVMIWNFR